MGKNINPEIIEYFRTIGKKGGDVNKKKGADYFKKIARMRKTFGRQKKIV